MTTEPTAPDAQPLNQQPSDPRRPLDRRFLLRGGAVLAGAAGATVLGAALGPATASAADGDPVTVGGDFTGTDATTLTIAPGADPALQLTNTDGPALRLTPVADDWDGTLAPGDLAATTFGPVTGVDYGDGPLTSSLATEDDLDALPLPFAVTPERLLDTRKASGRSLIVRTSSAAIDSAGRLKAAAWLDVAIGSAESGVELNGVFVNVAVLAPTKNGYLTIYTPGTRPGVSTINFRSGVSLSNAAFLAPDVLEDAEVAPGIVEDAFVVRIHTTQTTHLLLDLSGVVVSSGVSSTPVAAKTAVVRRRTARQAKVAARLKKSLSRSR